MVILDSVWNSGYFWNDIWYENPAVYHSYSIPVAKNVIVDPNSMLTNDNSSRLNNVNNEHWEKQQASGDYVKNFVSSN